MKKKTSKQPDKPNYEFEFAIVERGITAKVIKVKASGKDESEAMKEAVKGLKEKNFRYTGRFKKIH